MIQPVDIRPGGLRAEADPDDPGGGFLVQVQGRHHMAGLAPVAGGPGGDANAPAAQVADIPLSLWHSVKQQ